MTDQFRFDDSLFSRKRASSYMLYNLVHCTDIQVLSRYFPAREREVGYSLDKLHGYVLPKRVYVQKGTVLELYGLKGK